MAALKSFTDIPQSKKLAEILPLESADMMYQEYETVIGDDYGYKYRIQPFFSFDIDGIPCWSLAALYGILPNNKKESTTLSRGGWKIEPVEYIDKWFCEYENEVDEDSPCKAFTVSADNPVDACYEMVLKLKEQNLL